MREKIIRMLFTVSLFFSAIADDLRGDEFEKTEFSVYALGRKGGFC